MGRKKPELRMRRASILIMSWRKCKTQRHKTGWIKLQLLQTANLLSFKKCLTHHFDDVRGTLGMQSKFLKHLHAQTEAHGQSSGWLPQQALQPESVHVMHEL
eukprot:1002028-Pelagomonas_calceolata.AAC.13